MVVLSEPPTNDSSGLIYRSKPLPVEDFSSECAIEAFVVTVFPGAARIYLDRLDTNLGEPSLECPGLRTLQTTESVT